MSGHDNPMRSADAAILDLLARERPTYVPLLANRLGMNLDYAERRCETLADRGLIEPVSREVVYRITEAGRDRLDAYDETEQSPKPRYAVGD
jgi:predicted transcriptional regulator